MIRGFIFKLEKDGQVIQVLEREDGLGVEFVTDGGGFILSRHEVEKFVSIIDPHSYGHDRIRYKKVGDSKDEAV